MHVDYGLFVLLAGGCAVLCVDLLEGVGVAGQNGAEVFAAAGTDHFVDVVRIG